MSPSLAVYVDEAGDPGVRDGLKYLGTRHEWLCVSAVVVASSMLPDLPEWIREMRGAANASQVAALHYHKVTAERRAAVCEVFAQKPVRGFVLASHKSNMREYINPRVRQMIESGTFYNFCLRLLLERVTAWCEAWQRRRLDGDLQPLRVTFATRGGHDYEHFWKYVDTLRMQAENGTLFLKGPGLAPTLLDRSNWSIAPAENVAGLQLADTLASAFYQAANTSSPKWDLEPAMALRPIVVGALQNRAANRGVTVWPLPHQAPLPDDSRPIFRAFGYSF